MQILKKNLKMTGFLGSSSSQLPGDGHKRIVHRVSFRNTTVCDKKQQGQIFSF